MSLAVCGKEDYDSKFTTPGNLLQFHIKLFHMCEATSGYIIGFCVYTGKNSCIDAGVCLFDECTTTTQRVHDIGKQM